MKETGVVRHLDELGRIVIPKEIRKNLRINEGDLVEIFVDEKESVVLRKHTPFKLMEEDSFHLAKTLFDFHKNTILICDEERIVSGYGYSYGDYVDKFLSLEIKSILNDEKPFLGIVNKIIEKYENKKKIALVRLINKEKLLGCIIMIEDQKNIDDNMFNLLIFISSYFAKKL